MALIKAQKGLSMLSWLMVLAIVGFVASTAFKMMPHYMDNMALVKMITAVEKERMSDVTSPADFYAHMQKGMTVNGIRDVNIEDAMKVEVVNNEFKVHLKYEKREPMIGNLDLVARFDKEFRVRMP